MKKKKIKKTNKVKFHGWEDLSKDREQQKIYKDNLSFVNKLYSNYASNK